MSIKWPRIKVYKRMYMGADGQPYCEQVNFTEVQAMSVGTIIRPDGIILPKAIELIDKWNRQARVQKNYLEYSIFYEHA